jgi:hypothetical protein
MSDQDIEKQEAKIAAAKQRFDNLGVDIQTNKVRIVTKGNSKRIAEEFSEKMVALHGNEKEFFVEVPSGTYSEGDTYKKEDVEMNVFRDKRKGLVESIEEFKHFLDTTQSNIAVSPYTDGVIAHVNMRLMLQVHITNLIERVADYDRASYVLLEAQKPTTRKKG